MMDVAAELLIHMDKKAVTLIKPAMDLNIFKEKQNFNIEKVETL